MVKHCKIFAVFLSHLIILKVCAGLEEIIQLGRLNVDPHPLTISGFSSGGNMAQQMQVAFSSCFSGSGAFAGVPYHCGVKSYLSYRIRCNFGLRTVNQFVKEARQFETEGKIDSLSNLQNQRHFHYIPYHDTVVLWNPQVRANTAEFFKEVGMNPANIQLVFKKSDHFMPTANPGLQLCDDYWRFKREVIFGGQNTTGTAFCNYNGAFEALNFLFQDKTVLKRPDGTRGLEPIKLFDQARFFPTLAEAKFMDPFGYIYIPSNCKNGAICKFHVALHGCRGSRSAVGNGFVMQSGYLEVAEMNDIIMLFPQSTRFEGNPDGCWDAFEATGPEFATKLGVHTRALMNMIATVTGIKGCQ